MTKNNNLSDDTLVVTFVTNDRFYLYAHAKPNGMIDMERCAIPAFGDVDGSIRLLPEKDRAKAFKEKYWASYTKQAQEHQKLMGGHETIEGIGTHAELIFPEGPFDKQIDVIEMFIMGRSTCFKIRLKNGDSYPVVFESYETLENAVNSATERGSFLYPYPCHIILCHVDPEVMKFAIEILARQTAYFSQILPNQDKFVPKVIAKDSKNPKIVFANGLSDVVKKDIIDGVEVMPVAVITDEGKKYTFNFFDLAMVKSAMGLNEGSQKKWMFFTSQNMVVLKELTVENIQKCINEIYKDGVIDYYRPIVKIKK